MRQLSYPINIPNVQLAQISAALQPIVPGFTSTNARFQNVVTQGNYAYGVSSAGNSTGVIGVSLAIYNIQNPANMILEGYLTTGTVIWTTGSSFLNSEYQISVNGNYAYIFSRGSSELYVVDVSNPAAPFNVKALLITNSPGSLYGGAYAGGYAYLATQNKGLTVVNVVNPASISQTFQEGGTLNKSIGVYVAGGYAYTTNYQTTAPWTVRYLKIWSLANPAVPILLTTYTLPAGTKPGYVTVANGIAHVSDLNTSSVQVVNVVNPLAPVYLASMQATYSFNVTNGSFIQGNYAYITSGGNATNGASIDVFDITNPAAPVKVITYKTNVPTQLFNAAVVYNNILYVPNYGVTAVGTSYLRSFSTPVFQSASVDSRNLVRVSLQVSGPVNSQGVAVIQGSDDIMSTTWSDLPGSNVSVTGRGAFSSPVIDCCYQNIRIQYTNTGNAAVQGILKTVGF